MFDVEGQPDLDFLGDSPDLVDPPRSLLRRGLLGEIFDMPHKRYDPVFRGDSNMSGIYTRLPLKFVEHGLFQALVVRHRLLLGYNRIDDAA